jgi:hypothetical protein
MPPAGRWLDPGLDTCIPQTPLAPWPQTASTTPALLRFPRDVSRARSGLPPPGPHPAGGAIRKTKPRRPPRSVKMWRSPSPGPLRPQPRPQDGWEARAASYKRRPWRGVASGVPPSNAHGEITVSFPRNLTGDRSLPSRVLASRARRCLGKSLGLTH